jgi:hypothetical protein
VLECDGLGLEGCFFMFFKIFFVLNLLGFSGLDLVSDFILGQQKVLDVFRHTFAFANDFSSVLLGVLVALLTDFGSGGDLDLNLLYWLFIAFEAHAVDVQIFEVGEDFLLPANLNDEFACFVDHAKFEEGLVLVVFACINWECFLPCWQLGPSNQEE